MSRPWDSDRWRRIMMQALMWVILGGTLGLAQWVTYSRNHAPILLGPARSLGPLLVRLPQDWVSLPGEAPEPGVLEAEDEEGARELVISIEPIRSAIGGQLLTDQARQSDGITPITFKSLGIPGFELIVSHVERTPEGRAVTVDDLLATAELSPGSWIQVRLREGDSRISAADRSLLRAVADGITVAERKLPKPAPVVVPPDPGKYD